MEVQLANLPPLELRHRVRLPRGEEKLEAAQLERMPSPATQDAPDNEIPTSVEMRLRLPGTLPNFNLALRRDAKLGKQTSELDCQNTVPASDPIAALRATTSLRSRYANTSITRGCGITVELNFVTTDLKVSGHSGLI